MVISLFTLLSILTGLFYLAWIYEEWEGCIFLGLFISVLLVFASTLPSSFSYYYDRALVERYGINRVGIVTGKRIENYSMKDVDHSIYIISYEYDYGKKYSSEFILECEICYNKIDVGSDLPIQLVKVRPELVKPRRVKLAMNLGLKRNDCV